MVTVIGAAGCGKTRLAHQFAEQNRNWFADGVYWVELAPLADETLVPQTVARALRIPEQPGTSPIDGLVDEIRARQMLLVLDNCEHVLHESEKLARALLARTEAHILATSREPLRVHSEMLFPIEPLSLPPAPAPVDEIGQFDAIQLFVERARAILPSFSLTAENAEAIASICRQLDGMPLAVELATARVNVLTVQEIHAKLEDCIDLSARVPHSFSHHRSLRAALDWSHDLLDSNEQIILRRLSVFAGGCSLQAVETICAAADIEPKRILELLSSLVNRSLVVAETLQRGKACYSLLETIRQYTNEKLHASGEYRLMRNRHLDFFLDLAEETAPKLSSQYQQLWLNWLEEQYDNIRAALAWSIESKRIEEGLRISIALYEYWMIRDYVEEGLGWMGRLLDQAGATVPTHVRANALTHASFLASFRGNKKAQLAYSHEAAVLAESAGDKEKHALFWALTGHAFHARSNGDYQTEFSSAMRCAQLAREMRDDYLLGLVLTLYSPTAMTLGQFDTARELLAEGLPLVKASGDTYRIAMAHNYQGDLARCERRYKAAGVAYEQDVLLLRTVDAPRDLASALHNLGHTCVHLGHIERAQALILESMDLHQSQWNTPGMAECLIGFAALANGLGATRRSSAFTCRRNDTQ